MYSPNSMNRIVHKDNMLYVIHKPFCEACSQLQFTVDTSDHRREEHKCFEIATSAAVLFKNLSSAVPAAALHH